ncbi:hypothetical protein N7488_009556 [Penicillium malachiteum]|nr:hypothetical protein N7488_009556 [Penicillium malachiteum]
MELAAGSDDDNLTMWQLTKKNIWAILYCCLMSVSPMVFGFDVITVGIATAMPAFQESFGTLADGTYVLPAMWLSLWITMMPIGMERGGPPLSGFFAVAGALLTLFSNLLADLESRRGLFTGPKVILGWGLGFMLPASQTYVSEVAPVRLRGALLPFFTISMLGKHAQAIRAYTRLFSAEEAEEAVTKIESSLEHERQAQANDESPSYMQCFRGTNWRRTRIVLHVNMLQNFVGVAMVNQCTYFMELGGMPPYISLNVTTALLCVALPGYRFSSWYTMNTYGRRNVMLWACTAIGVLWLVIGIMGYFTAGKIFCIYAVVASETSTLRLRAKTQSIGFCLQFLTTWAFGFSVPYMYTTDEGDLGGKVGFIFGFLSVVA